MVNMNNTNGFTLIELMIAVAVIAILAAIAFPSYQNYRIRTNRVDVQTEMMRVAHQLQSYKVINHSYIDAKLDNGTLTSNYPATGAVIYRIDLKLDTENLDDKSASWQLDATPISSTIQKDDGVVKLNDLDHRCWMKSTINCTLTSSENWDGK